jgi:hypothetical protein
MLKPKKSFIFKKYWHIYALLVHNYEMRQIALRRKITAFSWPKG